MTIVSYKIEINDKNGKSLTYDSQTRTLVSTPVNSNRAEMIRISKIFMIILMIYFL